MLDPQKLKAIALAKKAEKEKQTKAEKDGELINTVAFTPENVTAWVTELESFVQAFAEDGNLFVDYQFEAHLPVQAVLTTAQRFKETHPYLMVITSEGQKKITVTWDGQNYV